MSSNELGGAQRAYNDLFVYENADPAAGKTPFDVFLECSDEKIVLGSFLGSKLAGLQYDDPLRLLDIGCGDASLAAHIIHASSRDVSYTGVDPVLSSVQKARHEISRRDIPSSIFQSKFEDYDFEDQRFDVILASNLYHLPTEEIPPFLRRATTLLAPRGNLFFVYRNNSDDILTMRQQFEAPLYDNFRLPRTIKSVINICNEQGLPYKSVEEATAKVEVPTDEARKRKIVEFILNRSVETLSADWLNDIYAFIQSKNNSLSSAQAAMIIEATE